jgi:hypothetical protein
LVQEIFDATEIPVVIDAAPYNVMTKGEMLRNCGDQVTLAAVASETVSCGHWKRFGKQCGRCVPCLIRRAAFHAAGLSDGSDYQQSGVDLQDVMNDNRRDDLLAMVLAIRRLPRQDISRWIAQTGPLPRERTARDALLDVARRGMGEVAAYLQEAGLLQ